MAHDADETCRCVSEHRPPYLELERHHVLALYLGGSEDGETVYICGTTHSAVHELLRAMLRAGRVMTYRQCQDWSPRPVARYAYALAAEGYRRYVAQSPSAQRST
jgi:hypothetical protein